MRVVIRKTRWSNWRLLGRVLSRRGGLEGGYAARSNLRGAGIARLDWRIRTEVPVQRLHVWHPLRPWRGKRDFRARDQTRALRADLHRADRGPFRALQGRS